MDNTESYDTNYHSTLLLLGVRDQAPPNFWGRREVLEVPSSRDALSQRRTFSCCGSLQVGLDREARALRERKKRREEKRRNEQWWAQYGKALNRSNDELADVQHDLQLAAGLHNTVLEHQDYLKSGDLLEELDPILIRFNGQRSQAGRVVNLEILRKELAAALVGVTAWRNSGSATKIIPNSITQDSTNSTVNAQPKPTELPVSKPVAQEGPLKRYSALIPGSFKSYMAWPGEKIETSKEPPKKIQGLYLPNESQDTLELTVPQELAPAATKQPEQDARIEKMPYPLGPVGEEEEEEKG